MEVLRNGLILAAMAIAKEDVVCNLTQIDHATHELTRKRKQSTSEKLDTRGQSATREKILAHCDATVADSLVEPPRHALDALGC